MTFEGGFFIIFGFMFGVPLLLGFAWFIGWLTGTGSKPMRWALLLVIVLPVAFSLYLDNTGVVRTVRVVNKSDQLRRDRHDSWHRTLTLEVEYDVPGEILPAHLSVRSDHTTFDQLQTGQITEVRTQDFGGIYKFAWLKHRSTFSLLRDLFPRTPRGPWRTGTATISEVSHVTESYNGDSSYELHWPYDVVEFRFTPEGRTEPLQAIDSIEMGSVPGVVANGQIKIEWPEDDPRSARIANATPAAPFANWLYAFAEEVIFGTVVIAGSAVLSFLFPRRKRRRGNMQTV